MVILILINLVSIFGYATFGLHPELLAQYSWAPPIFAASYPLFAQLQIGIGFWVIAAECQKTLGAKWYKFFSVAVVISFFMEYLGTTRGIPFGKYSYTSLLGWKIAQQVPILIPLSWFFMSLPSYWIARQISGSSHRRFSPVILGSILLMTWDFTLDPAMSHLTPFWIWESAGNPILKMPIMNLAGWFFTGLLILTAYEFLDLPLAPQWRRSLFPFKFYAINLLLPFGLALVGQMWISVCATLVVLLLCFALAKFNSRASVLGLES
jgi:putative membrane protein